MEIKKGELMNNRGKVELKKMVVAAMFVALTVSLSGFSIPVGTAKCFPVQHMMNVIAAVFLGPVYAVLSAFVTSVIRNIMGTGSLLAFPGSMVGALLCALIYQKSKKLWACYIGEIIGTGIIGGLLAYPVALLLMGNAKVATFTFVLPFLISTCGGTLIAAILIGIMDKTKVLDYLKRQIR